MEDAKADDDVTKKPKKKMFAHDEEPEPEEEEKKSSALTQLPGAPDGFYTLDVSQAIPLEEV